MSDETTFTLGLVAVAGLAMIPVVLVGRIVVSIVIERRKDRAAEARRVTQYVAGLGQFTSTNGTLWFGELGGLDISISTRDGPPDD